MFRQGTGGVRMWMLELVVVISKRVIKPNDDPEPAPRAGAGAGWGPSRQSPGREFATC